MRKKERKKEGKNNERCSFIEIEGEARINLNGFGLRDHSWGPRWEERKKERKKD